MKTNNQYLSYNTKNKKLASIVEKVEQSFRQDLVRQNCQKVASGIIFRLRIDPNAKELTTILADGSDPDNYHAITSWVLENEPDLTMYSHDITEKYTLELTNILDEILNSQY